MSYGASGGRIERYWTNQGRTDGAPRELSVADFGTMVSNERRLLVIQVLASEWSGTTGAMDLSEPHEAVTIGDLSTAAMDAFNDDGYFTGEMGKPEKRKTLYISLYQVHLPRLDEWDIIDLNRSANTITPAPRFGQAVYYTGLLLCSSLCSGTDLHIAAVMDDLTERE